jgi:peptidoglycan/xylan/chitin deacetylase (PgdA/CDA1 family)
VIFIQIAFYWLLWPAAPQIQSELTAENTFEDSSGGGLYIDTVFSAMAQTLVIGGKGYTNNLLGLWHNGRFSASTVSNNSAYEFPPQSLYLGSNTFKVLRLTARGEASIVDSFVIDYASHRLQTIASPLSRLKTEEKIVALTFDAGSAANGADSILSILKSKNLHITFFLTGTFIRKFPDILKQMVGDNHELANHTYSHPHLTSFAWDGMQSTLNHIDREYVYSQLQRTDSIFNAISSYHLKPYWRAPFGEYNPDILNWAAECGYKHIGWSSGCDTRDWVTDTESNLYRSASEIYDHLMNLEIKGRLKGAIILMHLNSERDSDKPYTILPKLIDTLHDRGYKIVTISDLILSAISS